MKAQLNNIRCWDPGSGFSVFLEKSPILDFAQAAEGGSEASFQAGPYRIVVRIESFEVNEETKSIDEMLIGFGEKGPKVQLLKGGHGSVFVQLDDVQVLNPADASLLGHARGCFDFAW